MYYHSRRHTPDSWLLKIEAKSQTVLVRLVLGSVVVLSAFLYVFKTNTMAANGYEVGQLNKTIKQLEAETRQLDVAVASAQSIARLTATVADKGYVTVEAMSYASIPSTILAQR